MSNAAKQNSVGSWANTAQLPKQRY